MGNMTPSDRHAEPLLKADEVARHLAVQTSTVYFWTSQNLIPFIKLGHSVRFRLRDIEKWLTDKMSVPMKSQKNRPQPRNNRSARFVVKKETGAERRRDVDALLDFAIRSASATNGPEE